MDAIQEKYLAIQSKLEKWCRAAFLEHKVNEIIRGKPKLATQPVQVKAMAREAWEDYNRTQSY